MLAKNLFFFVTKGKWVKGMLEICYFYNEAKQYDLALGIVDTLQQRIPLCIGELIPEKRMNLTVYAGAVGRAVELHPIDTDDRKAVRQELFLRQMINRGDEFALGQIPASAEYHQDTGRYGRGCLGCNLVC